VRAERFDSHPNSRARDESSVVHSATPDLPAKFGRRPIFAEACREIREIEGRVKQVKRQLEAITEQLSAVEHLRTIPGVGLLSATALVGFIGDIRRFPSGRHFASYLGLTPREYSSAAGAVITREIG